MSVENVQQLDLAGMPLSELNPKLCVVLMLLQNLDLPGGLNDGFRMTLTDSLEGRLMGGNHDGEVRILPRIPLTRGGGDSPFILTRSQFSV